MADLPSALGRDEGHAGHDPELLVALLDRDLSDADRAVAEARVATCASCADLHADLLAITSANLALPTPARPRDFTLTREMAAALVQERAGEPVPVGARLTAEMTNPGSGHTTHDRLLIANLVDRSVSDAERARAEEQLAACGDCALLYDDLVLLSAATRALPTPRRPRDFTLSAADAERLRVRGWRRLLAAIGSSRDVFSRPLAVGLTTLGLAGLLVTTIPSVLTGAVSAPPPRSTVGDAAAGGAGANPESITAGQASGAPSTTSDSGPARAAAAPSPGASAPPAAETAPSPGLGDELRDPDGLFVGGESSPVAGEPKAGEADELYRTSLSDETPFGRSVTLIVAIALLLLGLSLFALRWAARRLGDG